MPSPDVWTQIVQQTLLELALKTERHDDDADRSIEETADPVNLLPPSILGPDGWGRTTR